MKEPAPLLHDRIRVLDTLRFFAAGAVLFQHIGERTPVGARIAEWTSPGVFGVVLFFLVSGFVIPMSSGRIFRPGTFAARRLWRIFPAIFFAFALVAIAGYGLRLPDFATVRSATAFDWFANLALVQDYVGARALLGVTWTLSLEFAWYIVFAGALICLGSGFDRWLAIAAPLGILALTVGSFVLGHRLPLGRIGMIYAAVLGCRVYYHLQGKVSRPRLLAETVVFLVTMAAALWVSFGHFRHPTITLHAAEFPWIAACVIFVGVLVVPPIRNAAILNNALLSYLGAISFSTYLLHPLAIGLAEAYAPDFKVIVSIVLTFVFAIVGYHLIEAPGQKLGRVLTRPRGQPAVASVERPI